MGTASLRPVPSSGRYEVAAFVSHIAAGDVPAMERMRSGHYVAYVNKGGQWFELNDSSVTALGGSPTSYPYLVFLRRLDKLRVPALRPEELLLKDTEEHERWVRSNLHMLRTRAGSGLQGKLRPWSSPIERRLYDWLRRYRSRAQNAQSCLLYTSPSPRDS